MPGQDAGVRAYARIVAEPRYANLPNRGRVANLRVLAGRSRRNADGNGYTEISSTQYDLEFWDEYHDLVRALDPHTGDQCIFAGVIDRFDSYTSREGQTYLSARVIADGLRVFPKQPTRDTPPADTTTGDSYVEPRW